MMKTIPEILQRYVETARNLWTSESLTLAQKLRPYINHRFIMQWNLGLSPTQMQLNGDGLSDKELIFAGLLFRRKQGREEYCEHFRNQLIVPHLEDGRVVYVTGRRIVDARPDGTPMPNPPNGVGKPHGYNLDLLKNSRLLRNEIGLWIVREPLHAARLSSLGQPAVAFEDHQLAESESLIGRLQYAIKKKVEIYFAPSGIAATRERWAIVAASISPFVRVCILNEGLDPDELDFRQIDDLKREAPFIYHLWIEWMKEGRGEDRWVFDNIQRCLLGWRKDLDSKDQKRLETEFCIALGMNKERYEEFLEKKDAGPVDVENEPTNSSTGCNLINNFTLRTEQDEKGKEKTYKYTVPMPDIVCQMTLALDGWPRFASGFLFVHEPSDTAEPIKVLGDSERLFGHFHAKGSVMWADGLDRTGRSFVTKGEYLATVRDFLQRYQGVELLPHEPPIENHYYAYTPDPSYAPNGWYFNRLCRFFPNCESEEDGILIRSAFLTPLWGGPYGQRPMVVATASDRGHGKGALTEAIAKLYGGYVDLALTQTAEDRLYTRLLSPDAVLKRIIRLDNVKGRFDSAFLENLVTSPFLSGHRLFKGEGIRANTFTVIMTGNSVKLSRDLADRSLQIRLTRPKYRSDWSATLNTFIEENRKRILADGMWILRRPSRKCSVPDRFSAWVSGVLSKCGGKTQDVLRIVQGRRREADEDLNEAVSLMQAIDDYIGENKDRHPVPFIKSKTMTEIVNSATAERESAKAVHARMHGHIDAGRLPRVRFRHTNSSNGYDVTVAK